MKVTLFTAPGCPLGFNAERQELQLMWHYGHAIETERCMIVLAERSATREAIGLSPDRLAANRERLTRLYGMPMGLRHQSFAVGAAREELEGAGANLHPEREQRLLGGLSMAYDEDLANRLRELLAGEDAITEKKMFGGLAFLLHGNMCVSASGQGGLLARIDPDDTAAALAKPHASLMEMGRRTMAGWIRVAPEGVRTKRDLTPWVKRSVAYAKTLAPK